MGHLHIIDMFFSIDMLLLTEQILLKLIIDIFLWQHIIQTYLVEINIGKKENTRILYCPVGTKQFPKS